MPTVTISAPLNSTSGVTIVAPTTDTNVRDYLGSNNSLAVSISTAATGRNLTSIGVSGSRSVWRLRNGETQNKQAAFTGYQTGVLNSYFLPAGTDTFVSSQFATTTHTLTFSDALLTKYTKAANTVAVGTVAALSASNDFNLRGTDFIDTLTGGNNNDVLTGFGGNDVLTGGTGADRFFYNNSTEGIDTIADFTVAQGDLIAVSAAGFGGGLSVGTLGTDQFVLGSSATTADQRFLYNSGALYFDVDGNGATAAVQIASLTGAPTISNTNIVVV